jgi:inositol-phosphate phosphatase / L-galactose 1-phosphate phosphatase / histidinol-phosphatase
MTIDLDALAAFAEHLADIGSAMLQAADASQPTIAVKADRSFVTDVDRAIEQRMRSEIAARFPSHGIIGEEEGPERPEAEVQWVLDPVDGTAPFIAGVPVYATLVAVTVAGIPVIGVADFVAAGRRFCGVKGRPTLQNGQPCRTRSVGLSDAMLGCMNPDFFDAQERAALDSLRAATAWRIYGTSSLAYGLLAAGRVDVCLDTRLQVYDFACYRPIIEGAGGVVTDWQGAPLTLGSGPRVLAAGGAQTHEAALARLRVRQPTAISQSLTHKDMH